MVGDNVLVSSEVRPVGKGKKLWSVCSYRTQIHQVNRSGEKATAYRGWRGVRECFISRAGRELFTACQRDEDVAL